MGTGSIDVHAHFLPDNDLAGFPVPRQLDALLTLTSRDHLHYGSDWPFTPEFAVVAAREQLARAGDVPGALLEALTANSATLLGLTDHRP